MPPLLLSLPTILSAAKEVFGLGRQLYSYVAALRDKPHAVRFDVVEVTLPVSPGAPPGILHFPNVPLLGPRWRP